MNAQISLVLAQELCADDRRIADLVRRSSIGAMTMDGGSDRRRTSWVVRLRRIRRTLAHRRPVLTPD